MDGGPGGVLQPVRVLLADPLPVCLYGLRRILATDPDIAIVGEVRSGTELVAQALALRPHVIVLDIDLDGMSGVTALARIRAVDDSMRAVVVSACSGEWIDIAYDAGASAALDKRQELEELATVVHRVAEGQMLPPSRTTLHPEDWPTIALTPREIEVLGQIVEGLSSKAIANRLGTATSTVEKHRESIRKKARVHNTAEIVRFGFLYFMEKRLHDRRGENDEAPPQQRR